MKERITDQQIHNDGSCTDLIFVLDRSGSMHGNEEDIVVSVNRMLEDQRKLNQELKVHITVFNNEILTIRSEPVKSVCDIEFLDVKAHGSTALLDAIGISFKTFDPENQKRGVMVIATDGMENASSHYRYSEIKQLIEEKEKNVWKIMYLGAGLHESKDAESLNIRKEDTIMTSKERIERNMRSISSKILNFRENGEWDDKLNVTNDWENDTIQNMTTYPDIAYITHEGRHFIVDTGSLVSFHPHGRINLHHTAYVAQRSDLMGKLRGHTKLECEGLIGNDISQAFRIWKSSSRDEVELAFPELSIVDAMEAIPMGSHIGIPTIELSINGSIGTFFLDTGTSMTYLRPGFVTQLPKSRMREYAPMVGEFDVQMIDVDLEIVPVGYRHQTTVGIFPQQVADTLLRGVDGILGFNILKEYEFVIDLRLHTFFIERKREN